MISIIGKGFKPKTGSRARFFIEEKKENTEIRDKMASLENGFNGENVDQAGTIGDFKDLEASRKGKSFALNRTLRRRKTRYCF